MPQQVPTPIWIITHTHTQTHTDKCMQGHMKICIYSAQSETHAQLHTHVHTINTHTHTHHHKIGTVETLENTGKWEPTEI